MGAAYVQKMQTETELTCPTGKCGCRNCSGSSSLRSVPIFDKGPAVRLGIDSQGGPAPPTPAPAPGMRQPSPPPPVPAPPRPAPTAPAPAPAPAPLPALPAVTGVLTPRDPFAGRSTTRFGIAEIVDLSFIAAPVRRAAELGGLKWFVASGGGTVLGGNNGRGRFTADANAGAVRLELRIVSGANASRVVSTHNIDIVAPSGALMAQKPGTGIKHTVNTCSVGFLGEGFMRPMDVSFRNLHWREGSANASATGDWSSLNNLTHATFPWMPIGSGNSAKGCKIAMFDTVYTGGNGPPYAALSTFHWPIPWQYRVGSGSAVTFVIANHFATGIGNGTAGIMKLGSPVFTKAATDPTSNY